MKGIIETLYAEAGDPGGVLSSLPGARTEAVPGPDGYSGCGLEGLVKGYPAFVNRTAYICQGRVQAIELSSISPLTNQDMLDLAKALLERISL